MFQTSFADTRGESSQGGSGKTICYHEAVTILFWFLNTHLILIPTMERLLGRLRVPPLSCWPRDNNTAEIDHGARYCLSPELNLHIHITLPRKFSLLSFCHWNPIGPLMSRLQYSSKLLRAVASRTTGPDLSSSTHSCRRLNEALAPLRYQSFLQKKVPCHIEGIASYV